MPTAEHIARALGGRRSGKNWIACCPAHDDRNASLSVVDGDNGHLLMYCHAGCEYPDVVVALRERGLFDAQYVPITTETGTHNNTKLEQIRRNTEKARKIWQAVKPADGTPVETYLHSRGITLPPPPVIGFERLLKHPSGGFWPAMVALVQHGASAKSIGIHRTYLTQDGNNKAPVNPNKMMLGNVSGGAVQLAIAGKILAIAEGIETSFAILQSVRIPTWAALSAGGIANLILPPLPIASDVVICADHDANGIGQHFAEKAADRFFAEGRRVRIAIPQEMGSDFNDLLRR